MKLGKLEWGDRLFNKIERREKKRERERLGREKERREREISNCITDTSSTGW